MFTVNHPLQAMAERIGGEHVRVELPAPADVDPAFWSPEAETILLYQEADLILLNGAGYAGWIQRASLPLSRTVDTSASIREGLIELAGEVTHAHGPKGAHSHSGTAFTTWIDPMLAVEQGRSILGAFERELPQHAQVFRENFSQLERELSEWDEQLRLSVSVNPSRRIVASHPVYQYLARRYELRLKSLHWEPGELPDESMWNELEELLQLYPSRWMLWEGEPLAETRERLSTMGLTSVVFAPCGNTPAHGSFFTVMAKNLAAIARIYRN